MPAARPSCRARCQLRHPPYAPSVDPGVLASSVLPGGIGTFFACGCPADRRGCRARLLRSFTAGHLCRAGLAFAFLEFAGIIFDTALSSIGVTVASPYFAQRQPDARLSLRQRLLDARVAVIVFTIDNDYLGQGLLITATSSPKDTIRPSTSNIARNAQSSVGRCTTLIFGAGVGISLRGRRRRSSKMDASAAGDSQSVDQRGYRRRRSRRQIWQPDRP